MFICLDCGYIFSEPNTYQGDKLEYAGFSCREQWTGCPSCSGYYKETSQCDHCGDYITDDFIELSDGAKICDSCYQVKNIMDKDY